MKKLFPLLASITALLAFTAASAGAATVVNGNFETGTTSGWSIKNDAGGEGSWFPYTGTTLPVSGMAEQQPSKGTSVVADQSFISNGAIYQDVALEAGFNHELNLSYWFNNTSGTWASPTPNTFDVSTGDANNQQARIDVIKATADPFSADPADVLSTIIAPQAGSPSAAPWTAGKADLTAFAGQTVRIRGIFADNIGPLHVGLDDVSITSTDVTAPALSSVKTSKTKYELAAKKPGFTLSFTSTEALGLTAKFTKSSKGKKSGKKCVKATKKNAKAKPCTRWVPVKGSISIPVVVGANKFVFNGKIGKKRLAAGTYRLTLSGADAAGNTLAPVVKTFKVLTTKKSKKSKK